MSKPLFALRAEPTQEKRATGLTIGFAIWRTMFIALAIAYRVWPETLKRVTLTKGNRQQILESTRRTMIVYALSGLVLAGVVNLIAWSVKTP